VIEFELLLDQRSDIVEVIASSQQGLSVIDRVLLTTFEPAP